MRNPRRIVLIALWVIAVIAVIAGWTAFARSGELPDSSGGPGVFLTITVLGALALGGSMLRRHPDEWTGPLLGVCALTTMMGAARIGPLGDVAEPMGIVGLATVLLPSLVALTYAGFPSAPVALRRLTWCWWATFGIGLVIGALGAVGSSVPGVWWHTDVPGPAGAAATGLLLIYCLAVLVGLTITLAAAVSHYRSMPGGGRAALRPIVVPLVSWAAAVGAATVWIIVGSETEPEVNVGQQPTSSLYTTLPALLLVVLVAGIWWIDTTVRQPSAPAGGGVFGRGFRRFGRETAVEQYLSRALADPSIRVLYPVASTPNDGEPDWVDTQGRPATPDDSGPDRSFTVIRRADTVIGLIEHDVAAAARPDAIELIVTGAGLIMETERLTAGARRDLERSRQLASRLLSASDEPRAELRSALVDGPLRDLAEVGADLESGVPVTDVAPRLNSAAGRVRTLSHGVFPTALTTGGLRAALSTASVPARRYPEVIEITAYLAAEPDRSATIDESVLDGEPALRIETAQSPSDVIRDRVTVLGGRIESTDSAWVLTIPVDG